MKHPELTPEERERLRTDYSTPAVERYAAHLLSRWPLEDAVTWAQQYRDACPSSNDPRRAFWSRVIVQILSPSSTPAEPHPTAADVVPSPIAAEPARDAVRDIEIENGRGVATESYGSTGNAHVGGTPARTAGPDAEGPPRRDEASPAPITPQWHDEDSRRPSAQPKGDKKQGSLF